MLFGHVNKSSKSKKTLFKIFKIKLTGVAPLLFRGRSSNLNFFLQSLLNSHKDIFRDKEK